MNVTFDRNALLVFDIIPHYWVIPPWPCHVHCDKDRGRWWPYSRWHRLWSRQWRILQMTSYFQVWFYYGLAYCRCKGTTFSSILDRNFFLRSQILTLILITLAIILKNQTLRAQIVVEGIKVERHEHKVANYGFSSVLSSFLGLPCHNMLEISFMVGGC